ncbi:hypothetical protein EON68_00300, partial [archaeon]
MLLSDFWAMVSFHRLARVSAWAALAAVTAMSRAAVAAAAGGFINSEADAASQPLLHAAGEKLQRYVLESDDAWSVIMLETDERCGKVCADTRAMVSEFLEKTDGLFNMAVINAHDTVLTSEGDEVEAWRQFNSTTVPLMMVYGPGPKHLETGVHLDSQVASSVLQNGKKMLYQNMRNFMPTAVMSLRASNALDFFSRPSSTAARVLLLSEKTDVALPFRKLSTDFA